MQQGAAQGPKSQGGAAKIKSGVYSQTGDFAGKTVAEVREMFGQQWKIADDAEARNGKQEVGEDYVIKPGDEIQFHKRWGEKGQ